ncbi:hypothetical protein DICPUDRAFT_29443 [Dictyostelium purpureum]|uniref:non-specific serine/threonine protein kinase n=1 Tax=Dictyostelium purpureum TaxID=5786 RepID=F0ZDP6_DICPU|nr:uncharacterized protein DICPUDRAFT_29443 [Dictyostelium purpureum]EGC37955.1 hypothetical protein DICPUDRAFT_29443 [Dictyostelium purpureum]|eukprot:XP_003285526.1 hypothetical protein DICPUDRAFT_29443 [Dictyostelium purpureum]
MRPLPDQSAFEDKSELVLKKVRIKESEDITPISSPRTPKTPKICPKTPTKTPLRTPTKNTTIHFLTQKKRTKSTSNDFDYLTEIGEGSFAKVFKAKGKMDNKLYAIKKSKRPIWETSERNQHIQEIENGMKLGFHNNIAQVLCAWEEGGHIYIQMELCERGNLKDALNLAVQEEGGAGKLPEYIIWQYLYDVAQGLAHVHEKGIMHLDIKPENLLFSNDGVLKIGDFGVCSSANEEKEGDEGDQVYMAPELLNDIRTPAADIFSLGITLYEMATNYNLPKKGQMWRNLREGKIPFPEDDDAIISDDLKNLILRMMDPDPAKRITIQGLLKIDKLQSLSCLKRSTSTLYRLQRKLF